jgi:DNA-binding CsgD family transcriptional regulator
MSDMRQRIESLSPRQFDILVCVARHLSSREIGRILGLSVSTVDSHVAGALQKLGVASRREAALRMIELGFVPSSVEADTSRAPGDFHDSGKLLSNLHELPGAGTPANSGRAGDGHARFSGNREEGNREESPAPAINSAMARVMVRYLLDGFYIIAFFAIMSAVALGANWIVIECEQSSIDPFVLLVLKGVSYTLVVLDAVGVVTVAGLLTYSVIRVTMRVDDPDG